MFIRMRTDNSVSGRGFRASYSTIDGGMPYISLIILLFVELYTCNRNTYSFASKAKTPYICTYFQNPYTILFKIETFNKK